jgi:hypothetical protein
VSIADAGDRVDARTSGGPVRVEFARGNRAGGNLSSSGGSVVAAIDPAVALSIDAVASNGIVNSHIPLTTRSAYRRRVLSADLNGGGSLLRLRSSGGVIEIAASR